MKTALAVFACLLTFAATAEAAQPCVSCMKPIFAKMKKALEDKKEPLFAKQWHAKGYAKNLVGGSGLAGKQVYRQGSRKGWYLKADFSSLRSVPGRRGGPWIVRCDIWSPKRGHKVDEVWALMVYLRKEKRSVILGAGEKLAQVNELGLRYVNKKPLAPPRKKRK